MCTLYLHTTHNCSHTSTLLLYYDSYSKMPNSGMLDHFTYRPPKYQKNWMSVWPTRAGYNSARMATSRFATFSRYLITSRADYTFDDSLGLSKVEPLEMVSTQKPRKVPNFISPFHTLALKPTCGYYFSRETDNRKMRIGIAPTDLSAWRTVKLQPHVHALATV